MHVRQTAELMVAAACLWAATSVEPVAAQESSVNPGINASYENPDVAEFLGRFEVDGRDPYDHRFKVVEACRLRQGMDVADVGAGTGLFTRLFAPLVGDGTVYAVDIAQSFVDHVAKTAHDAGLANVEARLCTADSVELPAASIDLAFVCDTYHHFEYPQRTMRSIHHALRPGGQVVLIDFHRIEGKTSEWVMGHVRAGQEVFASEIEAAGFRKVEAYDDLLSESYFVRFEKIEDGRVSSGERDPSGAIVHRVTSPYQSAETDVRVLLPEHMARGRQYPVLYVLPVEAGREERYGDGLAEIIRHDLHNRHQLICVAPSFAHLPWYCDHATDRGMQQESYFLDTIVPFVERAYPTIAAPQGRLLVGFSKSGWGAFTLAMRFPEVFPRAAAFDSPLITDVPSIGRAAPIFGTQENYERYRLTTLVVARAGDGRLPQRLVHMGQGGFRGHHEAFQRLAQTHGLESLGLDLVYRSDGPRIAHHWNGGWLGEAVELLVAP